MRKLIISTLISILMASVPLHAQTPSRTTEAKPALNAERLVNEWINRMNALDDWYISIDGKEQPEDVVNSMMELYAPDAIQTLGPSEDQIGTAMLNGGAHIREWIDDYARSHVQLDWRINAQTAKAITTSLVYSTAMPWGGIAASVELTAVYSLREDRRKFMAPGTVVIQFREDGKIQRLRLYLPKDETVEIFP